MKYLVSILLILLFTKVTPQIQLELCDFNLIKEVKANTSANTVSWSINPFTTYQVENDIMFITFDNIGTYVITALFNNNTCYATDKLVIEIIECQETFIYIPNAFTPNDDNNNDEFGAYGINIKEFKLLIYNRWGELLFESNDINNRWKGFYNLTLCNQDVYTYIINYTDIKNRYQQRVGKVTLIK